MIPAPQVCYTGPAPVRAAAEVYDEALRLFREAIDGVGAADRNLRDARTKWETSRRASVERGDAIPSPAPVEKAEKRLADARALLEETEKIAVGKARSLARVIAEHGDEWRGSVDSIVTAAAQQVSETGAAYSAAVNGLAEALALAQWIARCEERVARGAGLYALPPAPTAEAVLTHRNPLGAVELLAGWITEAFAEPVRPPGGRAEAPAA